MPQLNSFITDLGGANKKGLIIILFTITAGLLRPMAGKLADNIGRIPVIKFGIFIAILAALVYPLTKTVLVFLLLRLFHGVCQGFMPTGATAFMNDILPVKRRGIGMAGFGTAISIGIGFGQFSCSIIVNSFGTDVLFFTASGFAILSLILVSFLTETLPNPKKFQFEFMRIRPNEVFERSVLPVAIVMFLSAFCSGLIFVLTPDISGYLNLTNKGWFFAIYIGFTIVTRLFGGGISDKYGRREVLLVGMILCLCSMFLLACATTVWIYSLGAVVFGLATGISSPAIFAWTADLSHPDRRGIGAGTMFIALEFGIMAGSASTLITYSNTFDSIFWSFLGGTVMASLTIIYLIWHLRKFKY